MSQIHQDCNYAQQLLECIGNVCKCNKKTSKKINSGRCLFKNGEMCFTNRVCASGICGAECKVLTKIYTLFNNYMLLDAQKAFCFAVL